MNSRLPLIIALCLIHFLLGLDINIVSVSLPIISEHFSVGAGAVTQIVWIYFLILTCLLLVFGRIGDIRGFKKIYAAGIAVFTIGSFLSALSPSFSILVLFRSFQASGSAVLFALTPAIIAFHMPENIRGRVFGMNYSFTALGGIVGRSLSGFIVGGFGWYSIFLINIPVGILTFILIMKFLPASEADKKPEKLDFTGAVLIFSGLMFLLFGINKGNELGWGSEFIISSFILAFLLIGAFTSRQAKALNPLFDINLLKNKNITFSVLAFVFVYIITNGMIYIMPFYLQWARALDIQEAGLLMAVPSVMQFFAGYLSGRLSERKNIKALCLTALLMIIISLILHLFLNVSSGIAFVIFVLAVYGFSIGYFIPANTNNIMTQAPQKNKGSISSFMTTSVRLGSALGIVLFGAAFTAFSPVKTASDAAVSSAGIMNGIYGTFILGIMSAAAGLILIILTRKSSNINEK